MLMIHFLCDLEYRVSLYLESIPLNLLIVERSLFPNKTFLSWDHLYENQDQQNRFYLATATIFVFYLEGTTKAIRTGSNSIVNKNYPCQNQILLDTVYLAATITAIYKKRPYSKHTWLKP
jgi:hypothetical protein